MIEKRKHDEEEGMKKEIETAKLAESIKEDQKLTAIHVVDHWSKLGSYSKQIVGKILQMNGVDVLLGYMNENGELIAEATFDSKYRYQNAGQQDCFLELTVVGSKITAYSYKSTGKLAGLLTRPIYSFGNNHVMYFAFFLINAQEPYVIPTDILIDAINGGYFDRYLLEEELAGKNRWETDKGIKVAIPWAALGEGLKEYADNFGYEKWLSEEELLTKRKEAQQKILRSEEIEYILCKVPKLKSIPAYIGKEKITVKIPVGYEAELRIVNEMSSTEKGEMIAGYKEYLHDHSVDESELKKKPAKKKTTK